MTRSLAILLTAGLLLVGSLAVATGASAAAAVPTTTCDNGVFGGGGKGVICRITVVNRITGSGGTAKVTIRECHGDADAENTCTLTTTNLTGLVTSVNQCNGTVNGGGGSLHCSVQVINNFIGFRPGVTAATVNQCVGSSAGGGIKLICDPFPANTTGATITQCNGSVNGGGLRAGSTCTATGTKPSSNGVRINQCNGSANEGGALMVCSATITNNRPAISPSPSGGSGSGSGGSGTGAGATPPSTSTLPTTDVRESGPTPVLFAGIFLLAMVVVAGRRPLRAIRNR